MPGSPRELELERKTKTVRLDPRQFAVLTGKIDALSDNLGKWLGAIAEAINNQSPTPAQTGGKLVARYRIPEDQPPITFDLVGKDFKSAKGSSVGAGDIDLAVESDNPSLLAEMGAQTVSEDGNEVSAPVTITAQSSSIDMAVVTYRATNRDTGALVAGDSDEFIIGPGEATIGTLDSPVPLTEEPEPPPV